jgi:hypothetical protein
MYEGHLFGASFALLSAAPCYPQRAESALVRHSPVGTDIMAQPRGLRVKEGPTLKETRVSSRPRFVPVRVFHPAGFRAE